MSEAENMFFFIPHTHWEGAVFKTREEYLEMGLPNILRALQLLAEYPEYKFVLDQVCYVKPFLERYPEHEPAFRKYIDEKRLVIAGGTLVMDDVNIPGGESYIRQALYGKGYYRQKLGIDVQIGWQLDTFGHHAQMPQLLKLAGYRSFWFFRGVPEMNTPSEFIWEGLDGSQIPAYWLPLGYAVTYFSPKTFHEFADFMEQKYEQLAPFSRGIDRVGLAGADVCEPESHTPLLIREFNKRTDKPFTIRIASPLEYEAAIQNSPVKRPVLSGELNPIFQGTYSSRIELKQRTRELERTLLDSEKLGGLLFSLAEKVDQKLLWKAWEPMLFNQAHDLMSGVMTDHVYEDTLRFYGYSKKIAESEMDDRIERLIAHIDTSGDGVPIVVFNLLGWPRTDVVLFNIGFAENGVMDITLVDSENQIYPFQSLETEKYENGAILHTKIAFIAHNVPAMGYTVFHLLKKRMQEDGIEPSILPGHNKLENEFCTVEIDPKNGAMAELVAKDGNWPVLAGEGNVLAIEEDRGDFWELYQPLDGGSRIAMHNRHAAPSQDKATFSTDKSSATGCITRGPVFSEFTVSNSISDRGHYQTSIRLYSGLRRIEIHTSILNENRYVRYRVLFPTTMPHTAIFHEIPFGTVQRPDGIEFPAQNWIDLNDGQKGIALLNRGLPGNNSADGIIMLSLMRSTSIVAYGYFGGYEPGMSSDSGLELGKELSFEYALVPHQGNWQQSEIYRDGLEYNQPLLARTAGSHPGRLPARWGFVSINQTAIVISTLKVGEDQGSLVLRLYEATGNPVSNVELKLECVIISAQEVNLLEDPGPEFRIVNQTIFLGFNAFEIKTIKLRIKTG